MRLAKVIAFMIATLLIWGCNKNVISPIPSISFLKQSKTMVADSGKGESVIVFEFSFRDGDADIGPVGGFDPQRPPQNIVFTDNRDASKVLRYDFPYIPTNVVQRDGVEGTFEVYMSPNVIIARSDTLHKITDTVIFNVYVFDDADNSSNIVQTAPIVIRK